MAEAAPQAFNAQPPPPAPTASSQPPPLPDKFVFPSALPTPPFIDVDGIPNFRDMGGYLTATSYLTTPSISSANPTLTMFRRGLLYRCANPQHLTSTGNETLTNKLNIKHIFDLRSAPEVKKLSASLPDLCTTDAPTNPHSLALQPQGVTRHFTPVYVEEDYGPVALATKLKWYTTSASSTSTLPYPYSEGFVNAYRDIATHAALGSPSTNSPSSSQPDHKPAYPTILRHLIANPDTPLIFHCTAGKDRTGVLAALLLRLAGVPDESIAWDYSLTEPGLGSWRPQFIARIAQGGLGQAGAKPNANTGSESQDATQQEPPKPKMSREEAGRIVGSRAGSILAFLTLVVDREWGGVERYFTEKCGLSQEEVEKLRELLVKPVERVEDVVVVRAVEGWTPMGGVVDERRFAGGNTTGGKSEGESGGEKGVGDNKGGMPLDTSGAGAGMGGEKVMAG